MKKKIREQIFIKDYNGDQADVYFSDLPKDLKDNDIIHINREKPYYSNNSSYDAYTELIVYRYRDETDEEYNKRIQNNIKTIDELKKRRFERYLELKAEFE
jgi:hypothetical protein